jgi:hypothetical protein
MIGSGFAVMKGARRATRIGGSLRAEDKALANRRNRRHVREQVRKHGESADLTPKLWTDRNVI